MFESLFSENGLSLERMRGFLEMAEAGSIAGAAPGDVARQSLISRQIRELEDFFSAELTVRKGKTLGLAPEGVRLAAIIREQFQTLEDFRSVQVNVPRVFTLCAGASTLEWMVTPFLTDLARILGGVQLRTEMRRSRALVEAVREGIVDLGIVRRDAIPHPSRKSCEDIVKLGFHLCVPKKLLPRGATSEGLSEVAAWQDLPFAAGRDGGQLGGAIRDAMERIGVSFRPRFECGSMLQVRSLVLQEACAAILPSVALSGLDPKRIFFVPFQPLAGYGRTLVLHWNPRQMSRRIVSPDTLRNAAQVLSGCVPESS